MNLNLLGNTGINISKIGLGAGHLDQTFRNGSQKEINRFLDGLFDLGINFIDTAGSYGLSEELIGNYLTRTSHSFIISSKTGHGVPGVLDWTADAVTKGVDSSLKKLKVETIDIMHLHSCDLEVLKYGAVIEALIECKKSGKVRFIAYSGENKALEYAINTKQFDVIQTSDNLLDQFSKIHLMKIAKQQKIGIIGKRPLANFIWKYTSKPESYDLSTYWKRQEQVLKMLEPHLTIEEMIYSYLQTSKMVDTHIIGTSSYEHFFYNFKKINNHSSNQNLLKEIENLAQSENWQGII